MVLVSISIFTKSICETDSEKGLFENSENNSRESIEDSFNALIYMHRSICLP